MLEIFLNKANRKKKKRKGNLHLQRKPMLIYIMVLHYKTLCINHKCFLSPKQSGRQDKMVCQADFFPILFPQISTRDKLLN